jgi:glutathione peroxidase
MADSLIFNSPAYVASLRTLSVITGSAVRHHWNTHYGVNSENSADVLWNFEKFLLSRKGEVVARFAPDVTADDPRLVSAIDRELAKRA